MSSTAPNTTRQELPEHPAVQRHRDTGVTVHKPQSLQQEPDWALHLCSHSGWCLPPSGMWLGGCNTSPMASSEMTSLRPGQPRSPGWGLLRRVLAQPQSCAAPSPTIPGTIRVGTHRAQAQITPQFPKAPSPLLCLLHLSPSASRGFMSPHGSLGWHGCPITPCTSWTPLQPCPKDASPAPGRVCLVPPLPLHKWQTSALCAVPYLSSTLNATLYLGLSSKGGREGSSPTATIPKPKLCPGHHHCPAHPALQKGVFCHHFLGHPFLQPTPPNSCSGGALIPRPSPGHGEGVPPLTDSLIPQSGCRHAHGILCGVSRSAASVAKTRGLTALLLALGGQHEVQNC